MDALIEITKSSRLKELRQEEEVREGVIDVCEGIELYAQEVAKKAAKEAAKKAARKTFIETARMFSVALDQTIDAYIEKFHVSRGEAEKEVRRYYR